MRLISLSLRSEMKISSIRPRTPSVLPNFPPFAACPSQLTQLRTTYTMTTPPRIPFLFPAPATRTAPRPSTSSAFLESKASARPLRLDPKLTPLTRLPFNRRSPGRRCPPSCTPPARLPRLQSPHQVFRLRVCVASTPPPASLLISTRASIAFLRTRGPRTSHRKLAMLCIHPAPREDRYAALRHCRCLPRIQNHLVPREPSGATGFGLPSYVAFHVATRASSARKKSYLIPLLRQVQYFPPFLSVHNARHAGLRRCVILSANVLSNFHRHVLATHRRALLSTCCA